MTNSYCVISIDKDPNCVVYAAHDECVQYLKDNKFNKCPDNEWLDDLWERVDDNQVATATISMKTQLDPVFDPRRVLSRLAQYETFVKHTGAITNFKRWYDLTINYEAAVQKADATGVYENYPVKPAGHP